MDQINERGSTAECPLSPPVLGGEFPLPDEIRKLSEVATEKLQSYFHGQIQSSTNDYKLLEQMNSALLSSYNDVRHTVETISNRQQQFSQKYDKLELLFKRIDELDEHSRKLEDGVAMAEQYVSMLESKFKKESASQ